MKFILILTALLALGTCYRQFYQNQYRDYYSQISSTGNAIAMAPSTVYSSMGYNVDFAIGTSNGYLYFGSLDDYNLKYSSTATSYSISNLTWTDKGLHIVTQYEIKVVDPSQYNWSLLSMSFSYSIKNAVFGLYGYSILTAVSFYDRIEIFQNSSSIYNVSVYSPCFAMSFNSTGQNFYFITANSSYGTNYMYRLYIPTRTLYNTTGYSSYNQNSLQFVPAYGYRHLAASSNYYSIVQWNNYSTYSTTTIGSFGKIKFTEDGGNIVGRLTDSSYSIGILDIDLSYTYFVNSYNSQTMRLDNSVVDFDTKRSKIIVLTSSQNVAIISTSQNSRVSHVWIIIVGSIFGFLLFVGIIAAIIKRKRMRQQQQIGAYVQQNDVANPVVPPNYDPSANYAYIQPNQGFNNNQFAYNQGYNNNQGFNNNQGYYNNQGLNNQYDNNAYRPPQ